MSKYTIVFTFYLFTERLLNKLDVKSFVVKIAVPYVNLRICANAYVPNVSYKGTLTIA